MRFAVVRSIHRLVAFAVLCIVALSTAPQLLEPDDAAYQASRARMRWPSRP
jgi:hypothetical protein